MSEPEYVFLAPLILDAIIFHAGVCFAKLNHVGKIQITTGAVNRSSFLYTEAI